MLDRLERLCDTATRPLAFAGALAMLGVAALTVVDVLLRWLLNSGVGALNEITEQTFAVAVAATMPAGLARAVHLTVDVVESHITKRLAGWLKAFGAIVLLAFFALISWRLALYAGEVAAGRGMTMILGLPKAPQLYIAAALFALGTLVQAVGALNRVVAAVRLMPASGWVSSGGEMSVMSVIAVATLALIAVLAAGAIPNWASVARWASANQGMLIIIGFLMMWAFLLLLVPLAAVLGLVGVLGSATAIGFGPAFSGFGSEVARFLTNYEVATLPLFLMMGAFATVAGVAGDLYRLAQAVVGNFRGGLALATIAGGAGFGTVTGSSLATILTFGRISLPEMRARGYSPELATGCVAAGGNLGAIIPPSGPLILFALLTESSIGQLFVAAVIPGLLSYILYSAAVMVHVRVVPNSVPPAVKRQRTELLAAARQAGPVVILFAVVIGGMYSGVFTATEAAAVGAFSAFVLALLRGKLRPAELWQVMAETTTSTAFIYTLIFGAVSFSFFFGITSLPEKMTTLAGALDVAPIVIIGLILLVFLLLGCVMDSFAILVITAPIVTPLVVFLGYDIVWWGVINLMVVEMSALTPPFGIHVFVLKTLAPDVPLAKIFKGVLAFVTADVVKLIILVLFPIITLWLPSTMAR
jgi:C4-dicarboxylate transporter, DctM subunit